MQQHRNRARVIALVRDLSRDRFVEGLLFGALIALILFAPPLLQAIGGGH